MFTLKDLDLPIKKINVDGPAVRALETRKEANNHPTVKTEELRASYARVKQSVVKALKEIGSARP
jgi:hypothetical protein